MIKLEINKEDTHSEIKGSSAEVFNDLLCILHLIENVLPRITPVTDGKFALMALFKVYMESDYSDNDNYSSNHVDMSNLSTMLNNIRGKDND